MLPTNVARGPALPAGFTNTVTAPRVLRDCRVTAVAPGRRTDAADRGHPIDPDRTRPSAAKDDRVKRGGRR
jgi:hypothetical protein